MDVFDLSDWCVTLIDFMLFWPSKLIYFTVVLSSHFGLTTLTSLWDRSSTSPLTGRVKADVRHKTTGVATRTRGVYPTRFRPSHVRCYSWSFRWKTGSEFRIWVLEPESFDKIGQFTDFSIVIEDSVSFYRYGPKVIVIYRGWKLRYGRNVKKLFII